MIKLLTNIEKIHTTKMGIDRIIRNLSLTSDPIDFCKKIVLNPNARITEKGKNYYVTLDNFVITINKYSYTIITAHKIKEFEE